MEAQRLLSANVPVGNERYYAVYAGKPLCAQHHGKVFLGTVIRAVVLLIDEKTQIQALGRTQTGLPMKEGQPATTTHDDKRNGTTTLFAALNTLDGTDIGHRSERHRHQEFIVFLDQVDREVPASRTSCRSTSAEWCGLYFWVKSVFCFRSRSDCRRSEGCNPTHQGSALVTAA